MQVVNRSFLLFEDHLIIDWQTFFNHPVRNNLIPYNSTGRIPTGQADDYTTGCLLDYNYFEKYYKMIAIDLRKQQALDADLKAIQQITFTVNLDKNSAIFFIIKEAKQTVSDFPFFDVSH